jgi:hypothetical protein
MMVLVESCSSSRRSLVALQMDALHLLVRDLAARGILATVEAAGHFETLGRRRPRALEEVGRSGNAARTDGWRQAKRGRRCMTGNHGSA